VNEGVFFQFVFQALQHSAILNKHFARIQNASSAECTLNFQIAINLAPVTDAKQVNICLIKRKNHPVITHDDNAENAAKASHRLDTQQRVENIFGKSGGKSEGFFLNIVGQTANVSAKAISALDCAFTG
jgi:hypothetical protein